MSEPKLKIVHVTSAHKDGDVRIFHKECVSLAEAGFDVYHLVPNSKSRLEKGVKIVSFDFPITSRFKRMLFLVKEIYKRAVEIDADVYHLHDPELLRIALKLKKLGKKVIYDAHEDVPRDILSKKYIPAFIRGVVSRRFEIFENNISKQINGVIAATPFIRDRFLKANKNTIDINNFPIIDSSITWKKFNEKSENNICYVGGLSTIRGIVEIVQAVENLNCKLLLAGNFSELGLKDKVSELPGWSKTEFLGFVNRTEVAEIYNRAKIGLVTLHPVENYLDSLPVKMFEYMAAGIPVIASDFPLWKEIVEGNKCGICVDPLNPQLIADAIDFIIQNPIQANQMGENGKRLVKEFYNWDAEQKKLIAFYCKL